ncbi:hypothetical protein M9979_04465 [Sphingomonas sp. RP10(2022)]|uniref:Circumsporozoite protein n=1 Tax=Sphingomonas liriopis TaxID=2949094 RepID=A0A9X2HRH9_9SPHN|nr:hypothetical protein [Sphingomonas liriopis]MCP3734129.1 hypothetical protein [Sphingomonas liriopis]
MKTLTLAAALGIAALSLAACGPKTDAGNNAAATDTLTLNEEGDASLGNSDAFAVDNGLAIDNGAAAVDDNATAPATGNAL